MAEPGARATLADTLVIRDAVPGDWSFILETWLKGYSQSAWVSEVPRREYFLGQRARIARLATRPTFRVLVAAAPESADVIFGYLAHEVRPSSCVVHWVYTKSSFRLQGIAKALMEKANPGHLPRSYTHALKFKRVPGWSHQPYLLEDGHAAAEIAAAAGRGAPQATCRPAR